MLSLETCYKVLGVREDASSAEIKQAFRKKAKQFHPDKTGKKNAEQFQKILSAYAFICSVKESSAFTRPFRKEKKSTFDYHTWLLERGDEESLAKLVFWDLMHGRENDAVKEFKTFQNINALKRYFCRENFMDYGYILAEELSFRSEYYDAFLLLEQIIKLEYQKAYFKIFFPEVIEFTLGILKNQIEGNLSDELAIDVWERALDLRFSSGDNSFFLERMSKSYSRLGDERMARMCLELRIEN